MILESCVLLVPVILLVVWFYRSFKRRFSFLVCNCRCGRSFLCLCKETEPKKHTPSTGLRRPVNIGLSWAGFKLASLKQSPLYSQLKPILTAVSMGLEKKPTPFSKSTFQNTGGFGSHEERQARFQSVKGIFTGM